MVWSVPHGYDIVSKLLSFTSGFLSIYFDSPFSHYSFLLGSFSFEHLARLEEMDHYEMNQSAAAEVPFHQQTDEKDARVLQNLGYKQQLNVSLSLRNSKNTGI